MVNKNDTKDLAEFFWGLAGVAGSIAVLLVISFALIDNKFGDSIRFYSSKIADYARQQWQAGENLPWWK